MPTQSSIRTRSVTELVRPAETEYADHAGTADSEPFATSQHQFCVAFAPTCHMPNDRGRTTLDSAICYILTREQLRDLAGARVSHLSARGSIRVDGSTLALAPKCMDELLACVETRLPALMRVNPADESSAPVCTSLIIGGILWHSLVPVDL